MSDETDEFLQAEHSVGAIESHGSFTIDLLSLRRKMAAFQFHEDAEYILKLIQAGVGARASRIVIQSLGDDTQIHIEQPDASLQDLPALRRGLENPNALPDSPLRDLALAIFVAASELAIEVECQSQTHQLRIWETGDELKPRVHEGASPILAFRMKRKNQGNLLQKMMGPSREATRERHLLLERCLYSRVPILLEGKLINGQVWPYPPKTYAARHTVADSGGFAVPAPLATVELSDGVLSLHMPSGESKELRNLSYYQRIGRGGGAWKSVVSLPESFDGPAQLTFVKRGVTLIPQALRGAIGGANVLADGDDLATDLSGFRPVESEMLATRLAEMSEESCSLATEIVAFYDGKYSKNSKIPDFSDQLRYVLAGVGFFGGSMVTGLLGLHNTQILPLLGAVISYIVDSKKAMQGVVNSLKGFSKSTNAPKRALLVDSLERAARECPSRGY